MKILVVDDHEMIGDLLASLVRDNIENAQVILATTLKEGIEAVERGGPDTFALAVVDLVILGEIEGPSTVTRFREKFPIIPVLAISALDGADVAAALYSGGARGFLPKHSSTEEFLKAVKTVLAGERYVPIGLEEVANSIGQSQPSVLRGRQLEIVELLGQGLSDKVIANQLGISAETVSYHLQNAFRALEVSTRAQAVARAFRLGLIRLK